MDIREQNKKNLKLAQLAQKCSKNIGIIGSGIVGSAVGKGLNMVNNVTFYDIDKNRIADLIDSGFNASDDLKFVTDNSEIFFICVPTPDKNGHIDLTTIKSCLKKLSQLLKNKKEYFLVVVKSTVIPMTTEKIILPIIEKFSEKRVGDEFGICFNPEFLRESHAYEDFMNPDRIVIGEFDKKSGNILEELYSQFRCPVIRTDIKTAEMTKYANNCFYATKISFFNEIHIMCKKLFIDSNVIRKVVQTDRFYGIHPWEHGHSFGGKCLPKDLNAIIAMYNDEHIYDPILLKSVRKVNEEIDKYG